MNETSYQKFKKQIEKWQMDNEIALYAMALESSDPVVRGLANRIQVLRAQREELLKLVQQENAE